MCYWNEEAARYYFWNAGTGAVQWEVPDPEAATRAERLQAGIPLPDKLIDQIAEVCERCGAEFLLSP